MPGNQGGSNWGSTAGHPLGRQRLRDRIQRADDHPAAQGRRDSLGTRVKEVVTEGRYVTNGFGLFPTIISPPYTTLTAYDLNHGTIKWQIGLGDDLRLVDQGIKGTGTAATIKGGIIADRDGPAVRHRRRSQGPRLRQRHRQTDLRAAPRRHDERRAIDVRAERPPVSAGHGHRRRPWRRSRHRASGSRGVRAAAKLRAERTRSARSGWKVAWVSQTEPPAAERPRNHGQPLLLEQSRSHKIATLVEER